MQLINVKIDTPQPGHYYPIKAIQRHFWNQRQHFFQQSNNCSKLHALKYCYCVPFPYIIFTLFLTLSSNDQATPHLHVLP